VPAREEGTRSWRADPETTAASGGHLPPEVDTAGPLFDPLFDPIQPTNYDEGRTTAPGTATLPPLPDDGIVTTDRPRRTVRKPRPTVRRVKRTLKRVSPITVFKLSLFYYFLFLFVWLAFVAVAYWFLETTGVFDTYDEFREGMVMEDWLNIDFSLALFEKWALLIGIIFVVVGSLINAFLAFLYNLAADIFGGLEMTFVERDV
jgi:Transmembrane domain of unknown function (DUF3566)